MKKIAILFSNGTEEIEALTPVDVLRRAGVECDIVSVCGEFPKGSHGITVKADKLIEDIDFNDYSGIVVPGGLPGAQIIADNEIVKNIIKSALADGKMVAAICAAPALALAANGFVNGKNITCYPAKAFIDSVNKCANYTGKDVEVDGNVITANGPRSAFAFSKAICDFLGVTAKF